MNGGSAETLQFSTQLEETFSQLADYIVDQTHSDETISLSLMAEQSQFTRFNRAKVRQTGVVQDGELTLTLMAGDRTTFYEMPMTGNWERDRTTAQVALDDLRRDIPLLPEDPYQVMPSGNATSHDVHAGSLLAHDQAVATILPVVAGLDFAGLYAGGVSIRAYADSVGQRHWFCTDSFTLDYSLFTEDGKAVKGTFAGDRWDGEAYAAKLNESKLQLERLSIPAKAITKGNYRTYLAPAAVADLISMFSWGAVSEASLQRGGSALGPLRSGDKSLSAQFNLSENFGHGLVPRFNNLGEVAPVQLPLIHGGQLVNTLISSRTAKEYGKTANGASQWEGLRSPEVSPGALCREDILKSLDTGLYLSNLHYLNWSDRPNGRITGMTRYACFWVEHGELIAPIENLRFDESLYQFLGENLLTLTDFQEFIPDVGSYGNRELGGMWVPGALVDGFTYTL
ncbi:MAG: metallopeptidase TldD-related protein [Cyanobacteria bacterium P01_E01_bin.6]